jgi:hypothetical protein
MDWLKFNYTSNGLSRHYFSTVHEGNDYIHRQSKQEKRSRHTLVPCVLDTSLADVAHAEDRRSLDIIPILFAERIHAARQETQAQQENGSATKLEERPSHPDSSTADTTPPRELPRPLFG